MIYYKQLLTLSSSDCIIVASKYGCFIVRQLCLMKLPHVEGVTASNLGSSQHQDSQVIQQRPVAKVTFDHEGYRSHTVWSSLRAPP